MFIKKVNEFNYNVIEEENVNYMNIKNMFLINNGKPIYVLNEEKKYIGVISFGAWNRKIDYPDDWINRSSKSLFNCNSVKNNALELFDKFKNINEIPILNSQNELIYILEAERDKSKEYDIILEKWFSLIDSLSNFDKKYTGDRIKIYIIDEVGKHFSEIYSWLLDSMMFNIENVKISDIVFLKNKDEIVLDFNWPVRVTNQLYYKENSVKNVYYLDKFMEELAMISIWDRITQNQYFSLQDYLKISKMRNVELPPSSLFAKLLALFLEKFNVNYI